MLKPLIRTIPNLSGNVKIACSLSDFNKIDDVFECHIRYAKLLPISNVLAQKQCEVNLLNSTYEFDLKRYYNMYSSIFFDTQFTYSKNVYADANYQDLKNRDKDFEFGVKRISFIKNNGSQFAFFAPIWIENANDLPDYFLLHISIGKYIHATKKTIKININDKKKTDKFNYLSVYLNKYAKNLNTNVVFCTPLTNQATYYGIDLERGGFVKKIDNIIGKNYRFQSSINKFDLNITEGFRRNKICIKQVLPLCFMFSLEDILTDYEISKYGGAKINITGEYWKDNIQIGMYDFSTDYTSFNQESWLMKNGKFKITDTKRNIMNIEFPSLMEASYHGYEHFNKIQKEAVRWKLKYSNDDYPYITNMSPAFSIAQNSAFKYREYPAPFSPISVYDDINNNIISPLYNDEYYARDKRALAKYETIMQNNASNWFNVVDEVEKYTKRTVFNLNDLNSNQDWYEEVDANNINDYIPITYNGNVSNLDDEYFNHPIQIDNTFTGKIYRKLSDTEIEELTKKFDPSPENATNYIESFECTLYEKQNIFENQDNWSNVIGNKVYFKGILYDLSEIYDKYPTLTKIDKFGVFVNPNLQRIEQSKLDEIKAAHFTMLTDKKYAKHLNAVQSTHLRSLLSGEEDYSPIYMSEASIGKRMNEVTHDSLFFENKSQKDGQFLDLTQIGYDVYDLNKYYELKELKRQFPEIINIIEAKRDKEIIKGYYQIPIYRLSQASFDHKTLWFENNKDDNNLWIRENLFFNLRGNHNKAKYDKRAFNNIINKYYSWILECPLLIETEFVSAYTLKQLINIYKVKQISNKCTHYMFNPILVDQNEVYALNVFTETKTLDKNYGDYLPKRRMSEDLDFIYLDPYNMKNVMGDNLNNVWFNNNVYSHEFYAKFLNQIHLKIFIGELYKDKNNEEPNEHKLDMLFIKRRLLINDYENEKLELKDLYINILDVYKNDYEYPDNLSDDDKKDIIRRLLNDLVYDDGTQTWHFSKEFENSHNVRSLLRYTDNDPLLLEYNFELTFKKRFLRVNKIIWDTISINNYDQFVDLYLYRISREDDYPEALKYQIVDKGNFTETELSKSHLTLEPLFTSVFIKNQKASTIYIEYNQSKVSYATFGNEKFYRYDSDNTPLMVDISDIDITHNLVYGTNNGVSDSNTFNNVAYYSYSYLQNLIDTYDPDDDSSLAYKYVNKQEPFFDEETGEEKFNHLPTFDIIDNCEANVVLAHGTEPVLEYYSTMSYNYVGHHSSTTTSYYSQYEYERTQFENYADILHLKLGEHTEIVDPSPNMPNIHAYTSTYYTDDVMTYYDIHRQYTSRNINYDDLGIYDEFGISTYITTYSYNSYYSYVTSTIEKMKTADNLITYDATIYKTVTGYTEHIGYCTYGLMFIDAKFDNTNSSLNLIDKYHNDKKYFTNVNGRNIYNSYFSIQNDFNQFVPFMKFDLFNTLTSRNNFVVKPYTITINAYNYPTQIAGRKAYDIVRNNRPIGNITLERYFDSITPLITEVYNVPNTYMLKLENKEKHTFVKPEKDESVLYNENVNINNTNGVRVYSNKHDYERVFQIEEKHFNDNYTVNLESKISIVVGRNLTYQEVIDGETDENVLRLFANYIRKNGDFDDNEILFLFNKYDVSYDSYSTGIDYDRICKVYSLTIIFNLL